MCWERQSDVTSRKLLWKALDLSSVGGYSPLECESLGDPQRSIEPSLHRTNDMFSTYIALRVRSLDEKGNELRGSISDWTFTRSLSDTYHKCGFLPKL